MKGEVLNMFKLWKTPDYTSELGITKKNAPDLAESFISTIPRYSKKFSGRGIVIPGGGQCYFTNAWVCIHMLRHLGCQLPIELWYLGSRELDHRMAHLLEPLGVTCVNAREVRKKHPIRILNGWELKPFAIMYSRFEEVLLLDADNVAVKDPSFMFNSVGYRQTGAVFWPDYGRLQPEREIWEICAVPYRDEPEFETGQILIHKRKCWKALNLTLWYNAYSDFFYRFIHGDKETFHLAFRKLEKDYMMIDTPIHSLVSTMCQHDFQQERLFQHRNMNKWDYNGHNHHIADFIHEELCLWFLDQLRAVWDGQILPGESIYPQLSDQTLATLVGDLTSRVFLYKRVGHDQRQMTFNSDGTVGKGSDTCELYWEIQRTNGSYTLNIHSQNTLTCRLYASDSGTWEGVWLVHEKMNILLSPRREVTASDIAQKPDS